MENFKNELRSNMNESGGGLAINLTGKFESNRHAMAKLNGSKRTAGEVAKSLRKSKLLYYAKDVKRVCEEWHHAGQLPNGMGMAKTYFTKKTDAEVVEALTKTSFEDAELRAQQYRDKNVLVCGFFWKWKKVPGPRRKSVWAKEVCWYDGTKYSAPNNFTLCTYEDFENSNMHEGMLFYGYDMPSLTQNSEL